MFRVTLSIYSLGVTLLLLLALHQNQQLKSADRQPTSPKTLAAGQQIDHLSAFRLDGQQAHLAFPWHQETLLYVFSDD